MEEELVPGIGEETFQLNGGEILPEPPVEIELENGATLTGRNEIGNEFLRGINGYFISGHDPYQNDATGSLGSVTIQNRRTGRTATEAEALYAHPLEPVSEEDLERIRTIIRGAVMSIGDTEQAEIENVATQAQREQINTFRNPVSIQTNPSYPYDRLERNPLPGGENIIRPRNMSGLKRYMTSFLNDLRMKNTINGETFEFIVDHMNDY